MSPTRRSPWAWPCWRSAWWPSASAPPRRPSSRMDRRALVVSAETAGERLDRWLATQLPGVSRSRLKTLIDAGLVHVDGARRKAAHHVAVGERIEIEIPPLPAETLEPVPIALTVVHEDEDVLVLDKPAGM